MLEVFLLLELAIREDLPIGVLQLLQDLFEAWESDVDLETGVGDNDGVVEILLVVLLQNLLYLLEPGVCAQESDDSLGLGAIGLERNGELEVNSILGQDLFSPLLSIQLVRRSKYDEITEIMFDVGKRIKALPERLNVLGKLLNYSGSWFKGKSRSVRVFSQLIKLEGQFVLVFFRGRANFPCLFVSYEGTKGPETA